MRWLISIPLMLLSGCADLGYYWHSARGHLAIMDQRVAIDELLADETADAALQARLRLVREIRAFSVSRLELPDNDSYLSYVELDRPWLIQNLFVAPEFSTQLHRWCYPIIGCASYRGFFDESRLRDEAGRFEAQGFEIHIGKVSAYSTLGWFDDPVLSSFVDWPDYRLAGLLFHELTHQQLYIDDDTAFNESLASAVQQVGTELWLESQDRHEALNRLAAWSRYREEVIDLIESTRARLKHLYADDSDDADKRREKQSILAAARAGHAEIAVRHDISGGFSHWFAGELNNAKIGSIAAYNLHKDAFVHMIHAHNLDFGAFYRYARLIGKLDQPMRELCLQDWQRKDLSTGRCPATESITAS